MADRASNGWSDGDHAARPVRALAVLIGLGVAAALVLINALLYHMARLEREATLGNARAELREVVAVNTRIIDNDLKQIGRLFLGVSGELSRYFPIQIPDNADILAFLRRQRALMPLPGEIRVLDIDGRTLFRTDAFRTDGFRTDGFRTDGFQSGDAPPPGWFLTARAGAETVPRMSLDRGGVGGTATVVVAQRMNDIFGRFVGAVALEMAPSTLSERLVPPESGKRATLRLIAGEPAVVVATVPHDATAIGAPASRSGDGLIERMGGEGGAFATEVAAPIATQLAAWDRNNLVRWTVGLVTTLVLGALAVHAYRQTVTLGRALERLEGLTRSLRSANAAKTNFLANMSHELRTPLNAIIGFSEALIQGCFGPLKPPKAGEYLGDIHTSGRHLLGLVDDVLDLSRIESGDMDVVAVPLDIGAICRECVVMTSPAAQARGVTVHMSMACGDHDDPTLRGDPRRLRQAIANILSNAIRYNRPGGDVWLTIERDRDVMSIRVEDSGVGMTAEELASAFVRFGRAPFAVAGDGGTGLGLPITQGIIHAHGGVMTLTSEVGRGTVAIISLPVEGRSPAIIPPVEPDQVKAP